MQVRRSSQLFSDGSLDGAVSRFRENGTIATIPASSSVLSFSSSSSDSPPKVNYIEHRVSKMDTLPGVAIKYGVEKSRSLVNGFSPENGKTAQEKTILDTAENNEIEKSVRRRQKNDAVPSLGTPELLLEDNDSGFSGRKGKGLSMRPKLGSRSDVDMVHPNAATPNGDSFMTNGSVFVRKSSSTSSLQDSENSSYIWPTSKWTLNPEALARPLFDGLPKPINVWKNKAALD
ncbi:hypothetical protein BHM03_00002366 [Ensete ventricosum]|nr:hypothetical protein BHM03_00002366 [Ensete ventricosum]